jgi:hypothetical protein
MNQRPNPLFSNRYKTLIIPYFLHDIPINYLKILSKFNGDDRISMDHHIDAFQDCTNKLTIQYGLYLVVNSIKTWINFYEFIMNEWAEKKDC